MSKKNSIVISLNDDTSEIIDLADSLGYKTVKTFIQRRNIPDVNNYVGSVAIDLFGNKYIKTLAQIEIVVYFFYGLHY